jgi:chloramphenicol-sensitive protein RarD
MDQRRGFVSGLAAYVIWGFFPIYFHYLRPAGPMEILAHRVIWSVLFVALLTTAIRRWSRIRAIVAKPKLLAGIAGAAILIGVNWFVYIYGVNTDRVIETSLGYFITPLISVLFGVIIFREQLRPQQWIAIGIGTAAVAVITYDYGHLPWIALVLAGSFGSYGLVKKRLSLPPTDGLLVESSVLALPALIYLIWLASAGKSTLTNHGAGHLTLLVLAGALTAIPLLLFADAANRIPMTGLGILQYVAPVLQLASGVFLLDEPMPTALLIGFALVWVALAIFTWDALHHARRTRLANAAATAVADDPLASVAQASS